MSNWNVPADERRFWWVTYITVSRIPMAIVLAVLVATRDLTSWPLLIGLLVLLTLIEVSDGLDGHLARKWNVRSEWGAMLDPYSDSVSRLIVYFGLGQAGLIHPALVLVMAVRDVSVSYCRILLTQSGQSVAAMLSGKIKAVVQAVGAYVAILSVLLPLVSSSPDSAATIVYWGVTIIVAVVTLWSIVEYAQSAFGAMRARDGDNA